MEIYKWYQSQKIPGEFPRGSLLSFRLCPGGICKTLEEWKSSWKRGEKEGRLVLLSEGKAESRESGGRKEFAPE